MPPPHVLSFNVLSVKLQGRRLHKAPVVRCKLRIFAWIGSGKCQSQGIQPDLNSHECSILHEASLGMTKEELHSNQHAWHGHPWCRLGLPLGGHAGGSPQDHWHPKGECGEEDRGCAGSGGWPGGVAWLCGSGQPTLMPSLVVKWGQRVRWAA